MRSTLSALVVITAVLIAGCDPQREADPRSSYDAGARETASEATETAAAPHRATSLSGDSAAEPHEEMAALTDSGAVEPHAASDVPGESPSAHRVSERDASKAADYQTGTLTAGSFDDTVHFDQFQDFLPNLFETRFGTVADQIANSRRILIRVIDDAGQPVTNATIRVRPKTAQQPSQTVTKLRTPADGRGMLLTQLDGLDEAQDAMVEVSHPALTEPLQLTMPLDSQLWRIRLPQLQAEPPRRLDLALVIDTTGSMRDELEFLKQEIAAIADSVATEFPEVEQRYALIVYRDEGDDYVVRTTDFTGDLDQFQRTLSAHRAAGGGDHPEAVHAALREASQLDWEAGDTARVMFLVGDAPHHHRHLLAVLDSVQELRGDGVRIYPVVGSGAGVHAEALFRAAAFLTMGQYLFLTDHSGIGNRHDVPHVQQYAVERLDRLMLRMIASELSGKRLEPEHIVAIENGTPPSELEVVPFEEVQEIPFEQR